MNISNDQARDWALRAREKGLVYNGRHLPYYRPLVEKAREMRQNPTPAERKLWEKFLNRFPHRVLRQRPIDFFIADFYCAALGLVIEVDGGYHLEEEVALHDKLRTEALEAYGLRMIRFTNEQVLYHFEEVCAALKGLLTQADGWITHG